VGPGGCQSRPFPISTIAQLYNPLTAPSAAELPAAADGDAPLPDLRVGCRVVNAATLDARLQRAGLAVAEHPSFSQIAGSPDRLDHEFWTLHNFVADLVLGCKEGYLAGTSPMDDEALFTVFNRRSGPISAAISISIDAPG
jgi:hypothetical protein